MHLASTLKTETCVSGGSAPIPLKREHMGVGDISESVVRHPQAWCLKDPGRRGSMGHPLAGTREGQRTTRASRPVEDAAGEGIGEADPCSLISSSCLCTAFLPTTQHSLQGSQTRSSNLGFKSRGLWVFFNTITCVVHEQNCCHQ